MEATNIDRNRRFTIFLLSILMVLLTTACKDKPIATDDFGPEMAVAWNELLMKMATEEDGLLTLKGVRTEAMVFGAMHDALNAIQPEYSHYLFEEKDPEADPITAAAQAAYEVAVGQFPDHETELKQELNRWLGEDANTIAIEKGIALGKASARKILESRKMDNYNGEADYTWHPMAPGVYAEFNEHSGTPEGFVFGAGWAAAQPFMLESQEQFRAAPPPEISSVEYTNAFNEVKEFGSHQSVTRSEDQTHLAMWWKDFVESSHNRLARQLVTAEGLNLWEATRLFALLNMTVYDAYVNVFENKFHYNHWRPYTAIRWAENDENPDTEADVNWNNLHRHTYAFPSYPSAHGTASAAAMTSLAHTLGKGDTYSFTMRTEEVDSAGPFSEKLKMDPPTRSFDSFSQAGMEAALSRVYLGIHFRYDSEAGFDLGNKIGNYANQNYLTRINTGSE